MIKAAINKPLFINFKKWISIFSPPFFIYKNNDD